SSSLFAPTSPSALSTLSLHDALPIFAVLAETQLVGRADHALRLDAADLRALDLTAGQLCADPGDRHASADRDVLGAADDRELLRSEEHTSELQSLRHLVCRLLLEKKK